MKFIGRLRSGKLIITDDYSEKAIQNDIPFKQIVRTLEERNQDEPCMVYDETGRYYRTVARTTYTPLDLVGLM